MPAGYHASAGPAAGATIWRKSRSRWEIERPVALKLQDDLSVLGELLLDHPEHLVPVDVGVPPHPSKRLLEEDLRVPFQGLFTLDIGSDRRFDGIESLP